MAGDPKSGAEDEEQLLSSEQVQGPTTNPGDDFRQPGQIIPLSQKSGSFDSVTIPFFLQTNLPAFREDLQAKSGSFDSDRNVLSIPTDFRTDTLDSLSHTHFTVARPTLAHAYDARNDPWADPTNNNFTGYAKDGTRYTNGVQDAGPVIAPWGSEGLSNDRSSTQQFPDQSIIACVPSGEIVIFSLENYPTSLDVWMRFRMHPSSNNFLIGRTSSPIQNFIMKNGVLAVHTFGAVESRMMVIDFRRDDQRYINMISPSNHWQGQVGDDITDRHTTGLFTTTGVTPSLRLVNNGTTQDIELYFDPDDQDHYWIILSGDDQIEIFEVEAGGIPQRTFKTVRQNSATVTDEGPSRVHIDHDGWLWYSWGSKLYRNVFDYQQYAILLEPWTNDLKQRFPSVDVGDTITSITSVEDKVFVSTKTEIYQIDRGSMDFHLAYTEVGGGGGGRNDSPPQGEILPGIGSLEIGKLRTLRTTFGNILEVSQVQGRGGVILIRLGDDTILESLVHPDLHEDGAFFTASLIV